MSNNEDNTDLQVDVWGGHKSQDHLARYKCDIDDCRIRNDLISGYLLNIVPIKSIKGGWRNGEEFDDRISGQPIQ